MGSTGENKAMTKPPATFWSGETLSQRLKTLINPFDSGQIDCAAYTLSIGPEVYVSPNDQTADPTTVTIRKLSDGEAFTIPPGQFAFLLTEEVVSVPADALAFISIRAKTKFRGLVKCFWVSRRSRLSGSADVLGLQRRPCADPPQARATDIPDLVCEPRLRDRPQEGRHNSQGHRPPG